MALLDLKSQIEPFVEKWLAAKQLDMSEITLFVEKNQKILLAHNAIFTRIYPLLKRIQSEKPFAFNEISMLIKSNLQNNSAHIANEYLDIFDINITDVNVDDLLEHAITAICTLNPDNLQVVLSKVPENDMEQFLNKLTHAPSIHKRLDSMLDAIEQSRDIICDGKVLNGQQAVEYITQKINTVLSVLDLR